MKLSIIQMDIALGEPDRNFKKAAELVQNAAEKAQPDVIVLPEMWNTGYSLENLADIGDPGGSRTAELFGALAEEYNVNIVAGSIANLRGGNAFNTLFAFDRKGKTVAEYSKIHMFKLMEEHIYITPGTDQCLFELDGVPCGAVICYDIRFPELIRSLALQNCQMLFVPAEWPWPRLDHWRTLLKARAIENQMFVAACNRCGKSNDTSFFGHSMVIDPWGEILGEIEEENEGVLSVEIDTSLVQKVRETIPVFQDRRPETYGVSPDHPGNSTGR